MQWYEFAQNARELTSIYRQIPDLQLIHVRTIGLDLGYQVKIVTDIPFAPDLLPPRWNMRGYNNFWLELDLWGIDDAQILHELDEEPFNIAIDRTEDEKLMCTMITPQGQMIMRVIFSSFSVKVHKERTGEEQEADFARVYQKRELQRRETLQTSSSQERDLAPFRKAQSRPRTREEMQASRWYELAENPKMLLDFFRRVPELQKIPLMGLSLKEGKCLIVSLQPLVRPDYLPAYWKQQNIMRIRLHLEGVLSLNLTYRSDPMQAAHRPEPRCVDIQFKTLLERKKHMVMIASTLTVEATARRFYTLYSGAYIPDLNHPWAPY